MYGKNKSIGVTVPKLPKDTVRTVSHYTLCSALFQLILVKLYDKTDKAFDMQ